MRLLLLVILEAMVVIPQNYPDLHKKFEYKHSFKGPNLAQKDGSVPFWEIHGDAIASSEQIRLAPSIRSKLGLAVNAKPFTESDFFEVVLSFKVIGQGRIGADGLALWYTQNKQTLGPIYGASQYWNGLAIFFDSFDNDARRNNPYIMAMMNDGTKTYDHNVDGLNQELQGCQRDFRNRPFPAKAKVEYVNNVLTLYFHDGMTQQDRYEICFRVENIHLPKNGYFSVSAATGGLADDHDAIAFLAHSYKTKAQVEQPGTPIPEDQQKKFDEEFDKYWKEFEEEKTKFAKEHPDKVKPGEPDYSKLYEGQMERELRLIYETQNNIFQNMERLKAILETIQNTQGTHTDMLSRVSGVPPPAHGQAQPQAGGMQRHEINELLQNMRDASNGIRDIKAYVLDIHGKASNIDQRLQSGAGVGTAVPVGGGGATDNSLIRAELDQIKNGIEQIRINQRGGVASGRVSGDCKNVECTNCLSGTFFLLGIVVQSVVFFLYSAWRGRAEKAKFY